MARLVSQQCKDTLWSIAVIVKLPKEVKESVQCVRAGFRGCGGTDAVLFDGWISRMNGNHKNNAQNDRHQSSSKIVCQRVGADFATGFRV